MKGRKLPNTYQIGEVCQILVKENPELRGKGGCWGIVNHVGQFSCTVKLWDGVYTVGLQHLKSFNYLPAECEQMQVICDAYGGLRLRINRVYSSAGGVGAEVFGVFGEAESCLFDCVGG
ncbi:hypothetical protein [Nostoc linckia]|uniref:hypothetical protein n=1 Tax=Nostoc linckia TaxID=92942 RepID=UPI001F54F1A4|nr:hypothetical protein [Nostoc linckia]